MRDGDAPPADASNPAGSGRAHGAGEPRPLFPTVMEWVWAHNFERIRRWAAAHPEASGRPTPDPASATAPDHPGRLLRWLPTSLQRLYERLVAARPYARKTRPRPLPPDDEAPSSGQARHYRLEIAYDAFCQHRPPPRKLFRPN